MAFLGVVCLSYIHQGARSVHAAFAHAAVRLFLQHERVGEVGTDVWPSETQCDRVRGLDVDRASTAVTSSLFGGGDGAMLRRDGQEERNSANE